jgi:hypothetical protein
MNFQPSIKKIEAFNLSKSKKKKFQPLKEQKQEPSTFKIKIKSLQSPSYLNK